MRSLQRHPLARLLVAALPAGVVVAVLALSTSRVAAAALLFGLLTMLVFVALSAARP
jgi:hypothetical protein